MKQKEIIETTDIEIGDKISSSVTQAYKNMQLKDPKFAEFLKRTTYVRARSKPRRRAK